MRSHRVGWLRIHASPPWMHKPGMPFTGYGKPSKFEARTLRNIGGNRDLAGNGVSWTPLEALEGIITPSGLHFERHHNGVPEIDPAHHRLVIHGAVRQPLSFTVDNLLRAGINHFAAKPLSAEQVRAILDIVF